jgi:hypothetical protein
MEKFDKPPDDAVLRLRIFLLCLLAATVTLGVVTAIS